jgi:hypothetical protein
MIASETSKVTIVLTNGKLQKVYVNAPTRVVEYVTRMAVRVAQALSTASPENLKDKAPFDA